MNLTKHYHGISITVDATDDVIVMIACPPVGGGIVDREFGWGNLGICLISGLPPNFSGSQQPFNLIGRAR